MGVKLNVAGISFLLLLATTANAGQVFDVTKYGAKGDGKSDIAKALTAAWTAACASTSPSQVLIPKGTFALFQVKLNGPCKAPIELSHQGTLVAPSDPSLFPTASWISFNYIDRFTLTGGGVFDGMGSQAWKQSECSKKKDCKQLPINLSFNFLTNSLVHDVTTKDSKNFHVNVLGCKTIAFQHFTVTAPGDSVNTDGIHIGRSDGVSITDSNIATGDDCISLGDGSKNVNVTGVHCGPGHGISIGSLGKYKNEAPVSGVYVKTCTITGTTNGVRIKTWPDSEVNTASDMHFEDIIMNNVENPIIVDQVYCPWNQCNPKVSSRVKLSNISFKNIRGTSKTNVAVKLACSQSLPCEGVELADIDLKNVGPGGDAVSQCSNVNPRITGKQNPRACTSPVPPVA